MIESTFPRTVFFYIIVNLQWSIFSKIKIKLIKTHRFLVRYNTFQNNLVLNNLTEISQAATLLSYHKGISCVNDINYDASEA